jgi:hypothetical protein
VTQAVSALKASHVHSQVQLIVLLPYYPREILDPRRQRYQHPFDLNSSTAAAAAFKNEPRQQLITDTMIHATPSSEKANLSSNPPTDPYLSYTEALFAFEDAGATPLPFPAGDTAAAAQALFKLLSAT